jgi:hypothetical protein
MRHFRVTPFLRALHPLNLLRAGCRALLKPVVIGCSHANASIVGNDRVVFNIKGNAFRLVVAIDYARQVVFIKWVGSHADYDRIDAATVKYAGKTDQE